MWGYTVQTIIIGLSIFSMHALGLFLEKVYRTLFIGLVIVLPIAFLPMPWATLPHAKVGFLVLCTGIGIIAFMLARFLEGTLALPKSWVVFSALLLPISYLVSALATGASRSSLLGAGIEPHTVAIMFFWVALVILSALAFRGRAELVRVQYAFLISAGLVMLFQLARIIFGADFLSFGGLFGSSSSSIVGSWHDLGIFLGLAAFFATAMLSNPAHEMSATTRWLLRVAAVLAVIELVIVNTFDVWVGLAILSTVALAYLILRAMRTNPEGQRMGLQVMSLLPFIALGVISILFAVMGTQIHDSLPEKIRITYVEVRPSWGGTFSVAAQTLEGKNVLFGSGPNTFIRQWGLYKPSGVNETAFWNADFAQGIGFIPTSIVTVGLLAALAWIFFLLSVVYESVKALVRSSSDIHPFVMSLVGATAYLWVLSIVYAPGIVVVSLAFLLTGALVGWGMYAGSVPVYVRTVSDVPRLGFVWSVFLIAIALIALIISGIMGRTLLADMYVNRSVTAYNQTQNMQQAQALLDTAVRIDSGNDRAHRAALELGILQITALAASTSPDVEKVRTELTNTISTAIQHGLTAVSQNAGNYQNWLALARIYEQLVGAEIPGAYENAQKAYESAIKENPTNPFFHVRLAQLAAVKNDIAATESHLRQALAIKPNYAEALFMLTQLEVVRGNGDAALAAAQATALAAPQEPVAWFQFGALLFQASRFQDAATALGQAVSLNGSYANALYLLSSTYASLNRLDDAIRVMQRVQELNPGNTQVEAAIKTLTDLKSAPAPAPVSEEDSKKK